MLGVRIASDSDGQLSGLDLEPAVGDRNRAEFVAPLVDREGVFGQAHVVGGDVGTLGLGLGALGQSN